MYLNLSSQAWVETHLTHSVRHDNEVMQVLDLGKSPLRRFCLSQIRNQIQRELSVIVLLIQTIGFGAPMLQSGIDDDKCT